MSDLARDFDMLAVGESTTTRGRTVTEADVVAFAALTGDRHPQHVDAEWAARGEFGERIAHGLLVLSYAVGLMGFDPERVMALRSIREVVFKRPLRIGDTIHAEVEIAATRKLDERRGLVECRCRVLNQHGKLVLRASTEVVWRRGERPSGDAPTGLEPRPL